MDLEQGNRRKSRSGKLRSLTSERLQRDEDQENSNVSNEPPTKPRRKSDVSESTKSIREKVRRKERKVAELEPEINIIGEIEGGSDFGSGVCLRWEFDFGQMWQVLNGYTEGQTQLDFPVDGESAVWAHPLDLHFLCKGMAGWPRLLMQVWKMDEYGSMHLAGYGFTHIPTTPGSHEIQVTTWRPVGTLKEEIATRFLGVTPQLRDMDLLFTKAWSDRCRLQTTSSGTINIRLDVITRNFEDQYVDK